MTIEAARSSLRALHGYAMKSDAELDRVIVAVLSGVDKVALARAIHAAHRSAPYPWWHVNAEHCQVSPHIAERVIDHLIREASGE